MTPASSYVDTSQVAPRIVANRRIPRTDRRSIPITFLHQNTCHTRLEVDQISPSKANKRRLGCSTLLTMAGSSRKRIRYLMKRNIPGTFTVEVEDMKQVITGQAYWGPASCLWAVSCMLQSNRTKLHSSTSASTTDTSYSETSREFFVVLPRLSDVWLHKV